MNLKSLLWTILLVLAGMHCLAQKTDYNKRPEFLKANSVWAFGLHGGLDFNGGSATPITTSQSTRGGCASVADPQTGKLLFYSNGGSVWNANHQLMPNGDSLWGNSYNGRYLTWQGVCIVPVIDNPGKYYIFSMGGGYDLPDIGEEPGAGALFYNVVDMKLNNGLGDVVAGKKNVLLEADTLSPAMIAIPGDSCDIWLLLHHAYRDEFRAYHITKEGIDTIPVISNPPVDTTYRVSGRGLYGLTKMYVSPDRKKIVITPSFTLIQYLLLCQFDPSSGKLDSSIEIDHPTEAFINTASFSPDNMKLYITGCQIMRTSSEVYQFDLSNYDSIAITRSRKHIKTTNFNGAVSGGGKYYGWPELVEPMMRLYNDTIYIGMYGDIHRINKPNLSGTACDLQLKVIQLLNGDTCSGSLGAEVVFPNEPWVTVERTEMSLCIREETFTLQAPAGYEGYEWNDGSTATERIIQTPGTYWVHSNDFCYPRVDTFLIHSLHFPEPIIKINVSTLSTGHYESYQWLLNGVAIPGSTDSSHIAISNGNYQVIVRSGDCVDTSEIYKITNAGNSISNNDLVNLSIVIYPNPTEDVLHIYPEMMVTAIITSIEGKILSTQDNVPSVSVKHLTAGIYFIHLLDHKNNLLKVMKFSKLK